ncbi:MAG: hypothetical protein OXM61_24945 [Candidatus Poribacteria bacterium]|nr:hypothetical protein [Candidatus Poribacteria bacterium]
MKILVITPCSARQNKKPMPASELYRGTEHQKIEAGLEEVRAHRQYGGTTIKWYIISTKHGLIKEDKKLAPYNVPNSKSPILKDGKKLNEDISQLIKEYDLVFFLLGQEYVKALQLPFGVPETVAQIFITYKRTKGYSHLIPKNLPNCNVVELNSNDFMSGYTAKGYVFEKLCEAACRDGFEVFEKVKDNPQLILDIVQ